MAPLRAKEASEAELEELSAKAYTFYLASKQAAPEPAPGTVEAAPYPLSFSELARLIASGGEIPGIREIPDQLAEGESTRSQLTTPPKPWQT